MKLRDFEPQKSVDWYDPMQLAKTGIRVLISSVFGNFFDKREIQEALHRESVKVHYDDFADSDELWLDYISDTGDGFDATYTLARLLAQPALTTGETCTRQGQILIMGGDQVYPVATRSAYQHRLRGPYGLANPYKEEDAKPPHLYAIPGNHDWYDGLTSFLKVFGQERTLGNWRTRQTRSYFALHLPHDVWLFGIDVQLNSDIDFNQLNYFKMIMQYHLKAESKVILCTAEPSWVYHTSLKGDAYNNLKYFEEEIQKWSSGRQVLTLAGDLHHYARYEAKNGSQKITAGGGGAFMHPTHNLPETISGIREGDVLLKTTFPSSKKSRSLLFRNYFFPFTSFKMSLLFGVVYLMFGAFAQLLLPAETTGMTILDKVHLILINPANVLILLLLVGGLTGFTDSNPYNPKLKSWMYVAFGFLHGVIQALLLVFSFWIAVMLASYWSFDHALLGWLSIQAILFVIGGIFGGLIFGVYLVKSNFILGNHDNEAYSSLRWSGYKCFLRLHISKEGITIYPYGVRCVQKWEETFAEGKQTFVTNDKVKYELIENPIIIKF